MPTTYIAPGERTSPIFCGAFAAGCGGPSQVAGELQPGPVALWGSPKLWPLLTKAQEEQRTWYYGDNAYFARGKYYRITRNAYQHNGIGMPDPARFKQFKMGIKPWRQKGTHIVVCPNSPVHFQLFGMSVETWLKETVATIAQYTDRPIRIRWKTRAKACPLSQDLQGAWAVVVWSSNSALEALVAGIPIFVQAPHAATYRFGTPDLSLIETPVAPSDQARLKFCQVLAANQWTLDEIRSGMAWSQLREAA